MRITSSMYYKNIYARNSDTINNSLYDVNKQIASGLKIQYAQDDIGVFSGTMRLDNEATVLSQIKASTSNALKFSQQSDVILNEFDTSMDRMKTLLINAANATHDKTSLDAISKELRGLEGHLKSLANTSINGQYLFSGSCVDIKPITDNGIYIGNDGLLNAFLGSQSKQSYNVSGADLFLGDENFVNKEITTNVKQYSLTAKYPDFLDTTVEGKEELITSKNTIRDLMGDLDNAIDTTTQKHHFYIQGVTSNGDAFKKHLKMRDDESVGELLNEIGKLYGNTTNLNVVDVSINNSGQIVIKDKMDGSSKLEFHMVGATDFDLTDGQDNADIENAIVYAAPNTGKISNLSSGETNFNEIINPATPPANMLYVKEFVKSDFASATALTYDDAIWNKNGSTISSNISQIVKDDNSFAASSTKLLEVASGSSLDGKSFSFKGTDINGNLYNAQIDLANAGSTFSLDGGITNYTIYNVDNPRTAVDADQMTYKQLMDVMNMIVTDNLPTITLPATTNTANEYDDAIKLAEEKGSINLSYNSKIEFKDLTSTDTKASISFYDSNSGNFLNPASAMTFNSNDALTVRDPKTDFFKTIDTIISAVENYKSYPDASGGDIRSVGIQNALSMVDDLSVHLAKMHSVVGAQTNALKSATQRTELLEINTKTLRSSIIDTDVAEAYLQLNQLNTNYQAMLSTVGKVSKLSLVNYL